MNPTTYRHKPGVLLIALVFVAFALGFTVFAAYHALTGIPLSRAPFEPPPLPALEQMVSANTTGPNATPRERFGHLAPSHRGLVRSKPSLPILRLRGREKLLRPRWTPR